MQTFFQRIQISPNRVAIAALVLLWAVAFLALKLTASRVTAQINQCVPLPAGTISWWPMNGVVTDNTGTNNPSASNAISFVPGNVGQGSVFGATPLAILQTVGCNAPSFNVAPSYTVRSPKSIAVGDFNGDGKQDLAVANDLVDSVSILLGIGNGGFGTPAIFTTGDNPLSVAVGDFNGDHKLDLAVANFKSNNVSVLLGDGAGGFSAAANFVTGSGPNSVVVGDFNGDGKPDLAVANGNSNNISVLLGIGGGSFGAATNFAVGSFPSSLAVGDFNGDGKPDLVVANYNSSNVSVLLGNGGGSFAAAANFFTGSNPNSIAIGDFNGDGKQDLVVATGIHDVWIHLGNGNGSFSAGNRFTAGAAPQAVAIGDFNGDGKQDLAVANVSSDVSVLLGNGSGGFSSAINFATGGDPYSVAIGDFNGDGKQDLAVANSRSDNLSLLINNGGSFSAAINFVIGGTPRLLAAGDFNGDGKPDLAVSIDDGSFGSGAMTVLLGNGNGSFGAATKFRVGLYASSIVVGDFNRDSKQDLAVGNAGGVAVLLGNGSGGFGAATNFATGGNPYSVAIGDFNGDGKPDVAAVHFTPNHIAVLLGNGSGGFGAATNFTAGDKPYSIVAGDFNNDGKQDLAVANFGSHNISVLLGNGVGGFGAAMNFEVGNGPNSIAVGDFNSDGKQDLAVANYDSSNVSVLLNSGNLGFGTMTNFALAGRASSVAIGDFNKDGKQDLAVGNTGGLAVLLGNGNGGFGGPTNFEAGNRPDSVVVDDFNGDGKPDVAVASYYSGIAVRLNNCAGGNNTAPTITPASAITRLQGTPGSSSTIATVNDADTPAGNLIVTVATSPTGITITNITNNNGTITASVAASCAANVGLNTVLLSVTDTGGQTATANLTVNVTANTPPTPGAYPTTEIFPVGGSKTVTPTTAPSDNGSIGSITATATGFTGSFSGNPANGALTINNAGPVGLFTVTVTATDNCGATATTTFLLNVAFAPDLQINAIPNPPLEIYTDTSFNLTWIDKNEGNARANAPWVDKVWFSTDSQLSGNDLLLGSFPLTQSLDPAQSVTRTQALSVPRTAVPATGQFFLIVQTDGDNGVNEQAKEDNNTRVVAVTAHRRPLPDLIVQPLSIEAPDTAFFDQMIKVRWTVKNIGGGSTDAAEWRDGVYFSTDEFPESNDPVRVFVSNVSYLAAGESYEASADIHIPRGLFGTYNIVIVTDYADVRVFQEAPFAVLEENEANNRKMKPIEIKAPPLPDLRVAFAKGPSSGQAFTGKAMLIDWRVENRGAGTRPDQTGWTDSVYLSKDKTLDTAQDRFIGSRQRAGGLTQNEGYTVNSFSVNVPGDIAGDWFLFVVADSNNDIFEFGNEGNNANFDQQFIHVNYSPPDLILQPATLTAPDNGIAARPLTVSWAVKNQGAFDAGPSWFDTIYLSSTATLNLATATPLATVAHGSKLLPKESYPASATVTLPACLSGPFYLFVYTDSRNQVFEYDPNYDAEANNFSLAKLIQITANPSDLRVTSVPVPALAVAGQPFTVSWTVTNAGGATLETSWTDRLYLSPTLTLDVNTALLVAEYQHTGSLAQNVPYSRTENPIVPTQAQGPYYLFVITDANDVVEECANDGNNATRTTATFTVSNNLPDLTITGINPLAAALAGQTIAVAWTGKNTGTAAAQNRAWNDAVYLSTNETLSQDDRLLATKLINGPLAINATYNGQAPVTIPVVAANAYYIIVVADAGNFVFEGQREANNTTAQPLQVQTPNVDLRVTAVDAPAQAFSGMAVPINWTVRNDGAAQTLATQWTDNVILSRDQVFDATDPVIGYLVHNGALNGGASYNGTLNVEIAPGLSGPYYVFVRTDANNALAEPNEGNNFGYDTTALTLQIPPPADLLVLPTTINSPGAGTPGENATLSWTVKNMGSNAAVGQWTDAVYLSTNQTWDIGDAEVGRVDHSGPLAAGQSYTGALTAKLPAVTPGSYYVIVRTDVRNRVREENENKNNNTAVSTGRMSVDVPTLTLGVPTNSTLQMGQERFYKVNVPGNETLRLALDGQSPQNFNELFARFGLLPSRSAYDFLYNRPYEPDQEIVVPDTKAGTYYSQARGAYVPNGTDPFSIKAEVVPFGITSVSPNRIGDNGQVTITINGAKFQDGATVKLVRGNTVLNAAKVWLVDSATVKARFFLSNALHGVYNLVLMNPGSTFTTQQQAVVIEGATHVLINLSVIGDTRPRIGRLMITQGLLSNTGNVDIPYAIVTSQFLGEVKMTFQRPNSTLPKQTDFPNADWENASPTMHYSDGITQDSFTVRDLEPQQQLNFTLRVSGFEPNPTAANVSVIARTKDEYIENLHTAAEMMRQLALEDPSIQFSPDLASVVNDPTKWRVAVETIYSTFGFIDSESTGTMVANTSFMQQKVAAQTMADSCSDPDECFRKSQKCVQGAKEHFKQCFVGALTLFILKGPTAFGLAVLACEAILTYDLLQCADMDKKCKKDCKKGPNKEPFCSLNCEKLKCKMKGGAFWEKCFLTIDEETGEPVREDCYTGCIVPIRSADPNDKIGPVGFGSQELVPLQQRFPYTVNFENIASATAVAQRIRITDQLDANLDWRTFRLKEIGLGSYRILISDNRAFFQDRLQLGADAGNVLADISAGLDITTGQVFWTLTAIDPNTGEQPNSAALGLLPPNDSTGRGQGYVSYTVQPRADKPTGTVISNKATIIFDTNEPIVTNTVTNTLDADAPVSAVAALPAASSATFPLNWSGSDPANGSGLQSFDIWVAENDGPYQPFLTGTTETSAQFTGANGKLYRFYSTARDNAGNVEAAPAVPDAVTLVGTVTNLAPALTALTPGGVVTGGAAFTLTVNGNGFAPGSVVRWNGAARTTAFISPAQLNAAIPASDIAGTGTANITVFTPAPGGGTSGALSFTVAGQALPVPAIANLSPGFAATGGAAFSLTINGTNFVSSSKVRWNGGELATTFVSNTQLRAAVTAAELTAAGTASVAVFNPAPGGGTSNGAPFSIAPQVVSVSAASYNTTPLASEAIIAAFGNGLATATRASTTLPLPTELFGTTVRVKDSNGAERFAPLFFVSPTQVNYQIPPETAAGAATVTITGSNGALSIGVVQIAAVAPGLFTADASGRGLPAAVALRVSADGSQSYEPVARFDTATNRFVAVPISFGPANEQVFLILFGTGIRNRSSLAALTVTIGGVAAPVSFAGKLGGFAGLDQVNALIPRSLSGRGEVDVLVTVDGRAANTVKVQIR